MYLRSILLAFTGSQILSCSTLLVWAQQLADLGGDRGVEWSDSWSDDDLREAALASLERFEHQERERP